MIRALFLPDALFAQKLVGLEISKNAVFACQISQKKEVVKIQKTISANIEANNENTHEEQLVAALKQVLSQVDGELIRLTIPSNQVFFKEVTIPFLDYHKIKMVLGYEIESTLPFSLQEAVIDFIITKQDKVKKESTVLAVVAQKKQLNYYLDLIHQTKAKIKVGAITTDLLGTYALYALLYRTNKNQYQVLLELGKTSITIVYLVNGNIEFVRNLPYGINNLIAKIASQSKRTPKDLAEFLLRFGLEETTEIDLMTPFAKLVDDVAFTINSFKAQVGPNVLLNNVLIVESALPIKDIARYLTAKTKLTCTTLDLNKIGAHSNFTLLPGATINPITLPCMVAAITCAENKDFNLLPTDALNTDLARYQIITMITITTLILTSIYGFWFIKNKTLNSTLLSYKKQASEKLKKAFSDVDDDLSTAISQAALRVNNEKKLWFSFSNQTRYSSLKYLQVLSDAIDMKKLNLDIKKLIIVDNTMTIQGSVEKFEDLYPFEQALTSVPIFTSITKPQEKNFTIKITLKQNDKDSA